MDSDRIDALEIEMKRQAETIMTMIGQSERRGRAASEEVALTCTNAFMRRWVLCCTRRSKDEEPHGLPYTTNDERESTAVLNGHTEG